MQHLKQISNDKHVIRYLTYQPNYYISIMSRWVGSECRLAKVNPGVLRDIGACEAVLLSTAKTHAAPWSSASAPHATPSVPSGSAGLANSTV